VDLHDPQRSAVLDSTKIDVSNPDLSAAAEALVRLLELGLNSQERQDLQAEVSSKADATRSYVEGRGYLLRRDRGDKLDLAAVDFREAVESDPDYAVAWAGLAEAVWQKYKTQGEARLLEESAGYAQRALGINKRLASVHIVMGQIRRAQKNYPAASEELQAALALEPANARALRALGDLNQDTGKFDDAERAYNKAVEIRQGDAEGHINLGAFYRVRQRLPEAQVSFARAVDLAPDSYLAHNNLGVVYLQEKKYQDAIDEFKKSLAIAPNARAYNNEGAAHYSLGHYTDAALAYAEAVKLADKRSIYVGNLAEAYLLAHVPDKARDAYRTAIKLLNAEIKSDPGNADLHARIALYYSHLPNRNLALREIRDALSRNSTASSDVQFKAVLVYEELGEHKMAMEIVRALYQAGHPPPEIQTSPFLERLRHDPEFLHMASPRF
jgi:serine/threonine-protein kinase